MIGKRMLVLSGVLCVSLLLSACLTTESRRRWKVNRARSMAQEGCYVEALDLLEQTSEKCEDPAFKKSIKPMMIAYRAGAMEEAASDYDKAVAMARGLAQQGDFRKAVKLIEKAEKNLTDPAQLKHLKMMKIAYKVEM